MEPIRLGGLGIICQIDESLFVHKVKYHRGRAPRRQVWVFGIVDTSTSPAIGYMRIVEDRSAATLLPIVQEVCLPGTIIHSDMWAGYRELSERTGFDHGTVNHRFNFVDPITGVHTQHVESFWNAHKEKIKAMKGVRACQLQSHLDEFMFKARYMNMEFESILKLLIVQN
ncbi:hypothetical protein NGRA_3576 [Nosema granulosis]|uniref:ISXO2-like transposase domain-containing protein n=1 Tax=Nosema granulosis TaxID=83296 RepID=A0A9P6GUZ0_9MICR|nr:hypothetical protein NGRA_3576 [Nosema granulosis]